MKKRVLSVFMAMMLIATSLLPGCGKSETTSNKEGEVTSGRTELVLWDYYGSNYHGKLQEMAELFNASQDSYKLKVEQGGTIIQKMELMKQEDYPSLFMCKNNTLGTLIDSKYTVPLQKFLDKDEDKWTDDILDVVKRGYCDEEGNMIGGILGVSMAGLMVNTTMLKQAGYELEDITSFVTMTEIAKAAHSKGLCTYGYIWSDGVDILDILTYQGVDIVDGGNGHTGKVTKCLYTEGETYESLKKLTGLMAEMIDSGVAAKNVSEYSGGKTPFLNSQALFWTCTNSVVYNLEDVEFEWAFIPLVGVDENAKWNGGVLSAGGGLFIADTGNEKEMQGAYEFIKFMAQKENIVEWSTYGGYMPFTNEALSDPEWISWRDEYFPSAAALEERMKNSPEGLRYPNNPVQEQLETANMNIFSNIIRDAKGDLDSYIKEAEESITSSIQLRNLRDE